MKVEDVLDAIDVLDALIDIYAKELYLMDEQGSRDWKRKYQLQLKIDRTNQVIKELTSTLLFENLL